jgi:asparagine synthetase B (glutamine-hydrolysing)
MLRPTPLEVALGALLGTADAPSLPSPGPDNTPREAFEAAILPALERTPCVVTFSGGRDSSAVLAVACDVARREGLPQPVPVTVRFADAPGTDEAQWQELLIERLGLSDWEVLEVDDDLDVVGPAAQKILLRHGVLYPPHCVLYAFLLEKARGGSLVTGFGGDQILEGSWRTRPIRVLRGLERPRLGDVGAAVHALGPRWLQRRLLQRHAPRRPWLRPAAQAEVERLYAEDVLHEPAHAGRRLAWLLRSRSLAGFRDTFALLARDADALDVHPLWDPSFVAALAEAAGRAGFGSRTNALRLLCDGLLPTSLLERTDKAVFHHAYWRTPSRDLARRWNGAGLDEALIDPELLRQAVLALVPNGHTGLALQTVWLASDGAAQREEEVAHLPEDVERPGAAKLPRR